MHPIAMARARRLDNFSTWVTVPQLLRASAGTLLEDFESAAEWTLAGGTGGPPTLTDDAVNYQVGTQSIRYQANGATGTITIEKTVSWNLLNAGKYFELWVRMGFSDSVTMYLYSGSKYFLYGTPFSRYSDSSWEVLRWNRLSPTVTSGGMSWSDVIDKIKFVFTHVEEDTNFDGLYHCDVTPAVCFTFDDIPVNAALNAPRALEIHNIKGTGFHTGGFIGDTGYMTADQMNEWIRIGWVIGNHTHDHTNLTTLTQAQIETQLTDCIADFNAAGVVGHQADKYAAYPYGSFAADTVAAMTAQAFRWGRAVISSSSNHSANLKTLAANPQRVVSWNNVTLTGFATTLQYALDHGEIFVTYFHGVDFDVLSGTDITVSMLGQFAAWCARYKVIVLTVDEMWQLVSGNVRVRKPKRAMSAW